jgi:carboxyl-terminal processing protease
VVRLQILPAASGVDGPPEEITLTRDKIKLEDQKATSSVINHTQNGRKYKLGVITLPSFYMDFEAYQRNEKDYTSTTRDVRNLIEELKTQDIDGLIMDLRDNGGGSLSEAIDLTGLFIKNGPVVQVKYPNDKGDLGEDEDPNVVYNGPVSVLINRFSASASEIFAAAIQDYQRGVVIGEQSYGKGTVQSVIDLSRYIRVPEGEKVGQLKLTLQKFYRVTGSSTQHMGVMPDVDLPSAFDAEEFGESSNESALAWDQIKPTKYYETTNISDQVRKQLKDDFEARLDTDVELQNLVDEANELKSNINKTRVSLNFNVRKKEMDAAEKRRAARNSMKGTRIDVENQIIEEIEDINDKYLRESVIIMSDYIGMIG